MDLFKKVHIFEPTKSHIYEPNISVISLISLMFNYAKPRIILDGFLIGSATQFPGRLALFVRLQGARDTTVTTGSRSTVLQKIVPSSEDHDMKTLVDQVVTIDKVTFHTCHNFLVFRVLALQAARLKSCDKTATIANFQFSQGPHR